MATPYVLLVEDEPDLADALTDVLRDHGYEVDVVMNGLAALHRLERRRADLVLLDVMLPMMNGLETLQEMRRDDEMRTIPVVVVTAMRELVPAGPDTLYDALVRKPFNAAELLEIMKRLLEAA